jgi:hypothetical protein
MNVIARLCEESLLDFSETEKMFPKVIETF